MSTRATKRSSSFFHAYLAAKPALPPPPKEVINSLALSQDIGMQGNDEIGLCTFADIAHGIVITTAMNKGIFVPQTADTIKLYEYTGYDPSQTDAQGNNPTDQGASLTEAANFAKKYGLAGHKLPRLSRPRYQERRGDEEGRRTIRAVRVGRSVAEVGDG